MENVKKKKKQARRVEEIIYVVPEERGISEDSSEST